MPDLNLDLENIPDIQLLPPGEHKVQILSIEEKTSKAGNQYLNVRLESVDAEMVGDIYHVVMLPRASDDKKQDARTRQRIKDFFAAFDVSGQNTDDLIGQTGWALVTVENDQNDEPQNKVSRFVVSAA